MSSVFTIQQGGVLLVCTAGDDVPANFIEPEVQLKIANAMTESEGIHAPLNPLFHVVMTQEGLAVKKIMFEVLIMPISDITFAYPVKAVRDFIVNHVRQMETGLVTPPESKIIV